MRAHEEAVFPITITDFQNLTVFPGSQSRIHQSAMDWCWCFRYQSSHVKWGFLPVSGVCFEIKPHLPQVQRSDLARRSDFHLGQLVS